LFTAAWWKAKWHSLLRVLDEESDRLTNLYGPMLQKFLHRLTNHDESVSPAGFGLSKTLKGSFSQNEDANWWMITLSDLTLLLLGFLVVWYLIDKKNVLEPKMQTVSAKIAQKLTVASGSDQAHSDPDEWQAFGEEMQRFVGEIGLDKEVLIESAPHEIIVSLKDTVPFDSGKADLRQQAVPVLAKVVDMVLSRRLLSLEVSGHSDNVPISTAKFPSNWGLSAARASRVARYLIENGINPSRISVRGYATQNPRVSDSSVENRSANRRVEIRLYHGVE
jgi:chemotaxis protein MotB